MTAYIIHHENKHITARTIPRLCQNMVNKGLNIPDHEFTVFNFDTGEEVTHIRYDEDQDVWEQYVPARYQPIKMTNGLKCNIPKVEL